MDSLYRQQLTTEDYDKEESVKCKNKPQTSNHRNTINYCYKFLHNKKILLSSAF